MLTFRSRFRHFPFRFRSLSVSSASLPATQPSASSFLPSGRFASQSALRPGSVPYVPFALPLHPRLVSRPLLSGSAYSVLCSFPFVLPCFTPTAVPQVLPFQVSPPGSTLDFRFLSSASVLASHYSASVSSFPLFPFLPHSGFHGARRFLSSPLLSPSVPPVSMLPFRFRYFSLPAVPFSASLFRVTGATSATDLLFPVRPLPLAFALGSGYLACRFELFGSPQTSHILPFKNQKVNTYFVHFPTIVLPFTTK